jgi:putative endonuclease
MKPGFVYMLTNKPGGVLYIGVTDDLAKRLEQHRSRAVPGFTKSYNCHVLVWFEYFDNIHDARLSEHRMNEVEPQLEDRPHRRAQSGMAGFE